MSAPRACSTRCTRRPRTRARCSPSRTSTTPSRSSRRCVEYIAPYQTVCNYWTYYWTSIGEHVSEPVRGGTIQRVVLRADNPRQDNRLSDSTGEKPVDLPANEPAIGAGEPGAGPLETLHTHPYGPAIDAAGNADCQTGQRGYLERLITGSRYGVQPGHRRRGAGRQPHRRRLEHPRPGRPDDRRLAGRREPEGRALMAQLPFSDILSQRPGHRHALSPFAAGAIAVVAASSWSRTSPTRRPTRSTIRTS